MRNLSEKSFLPTNYHPTIYQLPSSPPTLPPPHKGTIQWEWAVLVSSSLLHPHTHIQTQTDTEGWGREMESL